MAELGLHGHGLDGSPASAHQVVSMLMQIAGNYVEGPVRLETLTCTPMIDALATVQAVGVTGEGHVTGMVLDVPLEPALAKAICSGPEAFRQFVGEQVVGRKVAGSILVMIAEMGTRVTRMATECDRQFTNLLGRGWEALQRPGGWVFDMPVRAQDRLTDAARSLRCFVLSDVHHLLKVLRYRVLGRGTFGRQSTNSPSSCQCSRDNAGWAHVFSGEAPVRR
jgi:hypothetical protein